jgi:hypothetical protein
MFEHSLTLQKKFRVLKKYWPMLLGEKNIKRGREKGRKCKIKRKQRKNKGKLKVKKGKIKPIRHK